MLKTFDIDDVEEGMYVDSIAKQQGTFKITSRGRLNSAAAIKQLKKKGILSVVVDMSKQLKPKEIEKKEPEKPTEEPESTVKVSFEAELEEYTKDELALLRAWVERDLKDMRYYMADTGKQVASWLGIDIDGLSRRVAESLLSIADRSVVDRERFEEDLEAARADYCEGEMAAPGLMACTHCDAQQEAK